MPRCGCVGHLPDQEVTWALGHQKPAIEQFAFIQELKKTSPDHKKLKTAVLDQSLICTGLNWFKHFCGGTILQRLQNLIVKFLLLQ